MTSRTNSLLVALAALAMAACTDDPTQPGARKPSAPAPRPLIQLVPSLSISVIDLGTLGMAPGGANESRAYGINDSGFVTGGTTMTGAASGFENHVVFRWHLGTGMLSTGAYGTGYDINRAGTIVGWRDAGLERAIMVSPTNVPTTLGMLPSFASAVAYGINDAGYIAGVSDDNDPYVTGTDLTGTRWDPGTLAVTGYNPGSTSWPGSVLTDINSANQMVGRAFDGSPTVHSGFRYTPGVGYELIKPWSPSNHVRPEAINDGGTVAGSEITPAGTFPFVWSPAAGFSYLGPVGEQGTAFGINDAGYAVGYAASVPAFWKPDGTRVFLPRLAGGAAAPCTAWDCAAQAVNSKLEIAGYDRTAGGQVHAVVWRLRFTYKVVIKLYPFDPILPPIRLGAGGYLPVALLTTPDFDAREVKPSLLRFGNGDDDDTPVAVDKYRRPMVAYQDVDEDGDLDLLAYFDQTALEKNRDLTPETSVLYLTADLGGGTGLRGGQKVEVVRQ